MRIIVLGYKGNIGKPLVRALEDHGHDVVKVSRSGGDFQLDYTNEKAIEKFFQEVGSFDALISVAGRDGYFGPIESIGTEKFLFSFNRKMMGQFNMVLIGRKYINDGGHFILTSGFLSDVPNSHSLALGVVNSAVNAFAKHASQKLASNIKVNVVSPGVVTTNADVQLGSAQVYSPDLAKVYLKVLESNKNGETIKSWNLEVDGILYRDLMD